MRHVRAYAHRGGAGEATENSLTAFRRAIDLGYVHLETDVRPSRDGVAVLHHDAALDRTTDGTGPLRRRPWRDIRSLRLADGTPPLRLEELLEEFPHARINLDVKESGSVPALVRALDRSRAWDRVCITSFSGSRMRQVRRVVPPGTETSAHPREVATVRAAAAGAPLPRVSSRAHRLQVPMRALGVRLVDASFVETAHRHGFAVDVWTIDDEARMEALLDLGVDGIMTDEPSTLRGVLERRGLWPPGPEAPA